jgi:hypothetical protein
MGADQVAGGPVTQSFLNSISSQGLKWNRECICFLTPTDMSWLDAAGIHTLGMISSDPETACGSGVLQSESTYKAALQSELSRFPSIHNWEYGNEVTGGCGAGDWNIGYKNYFIGLVWTYQVITSMPGHSTDTLEGPTLTIWTGTNGSGNASCYNTQTLDWFRSFWSESYNGYTPNSVLTWVSLHVYTQSLQWSDILGKSYADSCAKETVSQMLTTALNNYYDAEGHSKQIVISETGFPSDKSGGEAAQSQWYKGMVPFFNGLGYIHGVFAYDLYDSQSTLWGLFDGSLSPKPAWNVYQGYLTGSSLSTSSSSTTSRSQTNSSSSSRSSSTSSSSSFIATNTTTLTTTSYETTATGSVFSAGYSPRSFFSSSISPRSGSSVVSSRSASRALNPTSNSTFQYDPLIQILSSITTTKDRPVAYGFAAYELSLIGGLAGVFMLFKRSGKFWSRRWPFWRW